ncbi:TRAP transporter substrate-binding protein DctP [Chelativorans sp. Marseille-P2723]|uniref:TRAP transporter substrate-binding protein n=1 Tax=Chelativorans sp. Marseille-P2723 TaxID=2709133 RepID=UPI00156E4FC8|nr:TRAP transporter substrate-binding protein DctP [Chelativorans sp. Marseille-P2723]
MRMGLPALLALTLGLLPHVAHAEDETLTLRIGDVYPEGHYMAEALIKPWLSKVKERLGDRVSLEYFPASQLGKGPELLTLTKSGVIDVGLVVPAFTPDKLPLSAVAELPGAFERGCQGTKAFWKLATTGILMENEYAPENIKVLLALVLPPYQLFIDDPIEGVSSFQGKKIYSTGGAKDLTVRALGAVPMRMPTQELYESLTRGTIDGGLMAYGTALAYRIPGLVNYGTKDENFGSGVVSYAISIERWEALPEDVRTVLEEVGNEVTADACAQIDLGVESDMAELAEEGVQLVSIPASDREMIDQALERISQDWARELDARGRSGSEVLQAFRHELSALE